MTKAGLTSAPPIKMLLPERDFPFFDLVSIFLASPPLIPLGDLFVILMPCSIEFTITSQICFIAEVIFSTEDILHFDLRYRNAGSDKGECIKTGQLINFPSGEGYTVPYEGSFDEIKIHGESKTEGILPVNYNGEIVKFAIKKNRIFKIFGSSINAKKMRRFFIEKDSRRNIAELGIGCNPNAIVTGNVLEDEKAGLHIAYGSSVHLGGKVMSDVHQDICYAKGLPIEGISLKLINEDKTIIEIICDAALQYDLL